MLILNCLSFRTITYLVNDYDHVYSIGFGRLCPKKNILCFLAVLMFFRNDAKIMLLSENLLSVTEIMLL